MWVTVKEYAQKRNVTTVAIYKKIKAGTIRNRKKNNVVQVWDDEANVIQVPTVEVDEQKFFEEDKKYSEAITNKTELQNKLKEQKLKNLQQDTILKRIKNEETVEKIRREFAELVFEAFTESFDDVKTLFISLKLDKENNQKLKQVFSKAIKKFQNNLLKKLEEGDKKDGE